MSQKGPRPPKKNKRPANADSIATESQPFVIPIEFLLPSIKSAKQITPEIRAQANNIATKMTASCSQFIDAAKIHDQHERQIKLEVFYSQGPILLKYPFEIIAFIINHYFPYSDNLFKNIDDRASKFSVLDHYEEIKEQAATWEDEILKALEEVNVRYTLLAKFPKNDNLHVRNTFIALMLNKLIYAQYSLSYLFFNSYPLRQSYHSYQLLHHILTCFTPLIDDFQISAGTSLNIAGKRNIFIAALFRILHHYYDAGISFYHDFYDLDQEKILCKKVLLHLDNLVMYHENGMLFLKTNHLTSKKVQYEKQLSQIEKDLDQLTNLTDNKDPTVFFKKLDQFYNEKWQKKQKNPVQIFVYEEAASLESTLSQLFVLWNRFHTQQAKANLCDMLGLLTTLKLSIPIVPARELLGLLSLNIIHLIEHELYELLINYERQQKLAQTLDPQMKAIEQLLAEKHAHALSDIRIKNAESLVTRSVQLTKKLTKRQKQLENQANIQILKLNEEHQQRIEELVKNHHQNLASVVQHKNDTIHTITQTSQANLNAEQALELAKLDTFKKNKILQIKQQEKNEVIMLKTKQGIENNQLNEEYETTRHQHLVQQQADLQLQQYQQTIELEELTALFQKELCLQQSLYSSEKTQLLRSISHHIGQMTMTHHPAIPPIKKPLTQGLKPYVQVTIPHSIRLIMKDLQVHHIESFLCGFSLMALIEKTPLHIYEDNISLLVNCSVQQLPVHMHRIGTFDENNPTLFFFQNIIFYCENWSKLPLSLSHTGYANSYYLCSSENEVFDLRSLPFKHIPENSSLMETNKQFTPAFAQSRPTGLSTQAMQPTTQSDNYHKNTLS